MAAWTSDGPGSREWVRARLVALNDVEDWTTQPACLELVEWLYTVVRHRTRRAGVDAAAQADLTQDAMTPLVRALKQSHPRFAAADNPAAVLERVAARAVGEGRHRTRMSGLSGVPANGQNWRLGYPRRIGGEAARRLLEERPTPAQAQDPAIEHTATRVVDWVDLHVDVRMSDDARDAIVYCLDRLVAGVSRPALLRGGHSALGADPAMRHLGFNGPAATAFGVWLLGRHDAQHSSPSVLDAAVTAVPTTELTIERWRRDALRLGFAQVTASWLEQRSA